MILTPTRIELKNFMTHRQEVVDFPEQGIVLLWGPSGAGKSSLLDAIGWSLFGVEATRAKTLEELRHELYPDEDMGVRLTMSLGDGRHVQIFRGVERGKSVAWMVDADGTLVEGLTAVKQRVAELLGGMDAATFFATYFSQQGELDALVRKAGAEKRKFIQRMLGITLLDKVGTRIRREVDKAQDRMSFIDESMPAESRDELARAVADARQRLEAKSAETDSLAGEVEAAKLRGTRLKEQLDQQRAAADRYRTLTPEVQAITDTRLPALEQERERCRAAVADAEAAVKRLAEGADARAELEQLRAEADRLAAAEGALEALSRMRADAAEMRERAAQYQRSLEMLPAEAELTEDPSELAQRKERLLAEYRLAGEQIAEAQANRERLVHEQECFTCMRPLPAGEEADAALSQLDEKIAALNTRREEITAQGKTIAAQLEQAQQAAQQAEQARRERERAQTIADEAKQAAGRADERLTQAEQAAKGGDSDRLREVRGRLAELSELAARLDADQRLAGSLDAAQQTLAQTERTVTDQQQALADAKLELDQLNFDPAAYERAEQDIEQARAQYTELLASLERARGEARDAQRDLDAAQSGCERYDELADERRRTTERHTLLKRLDGSMKDFKQHMIGQIRPTLEALTSQHLSELTDGRMPAVRIDEEYNLFVKRHGEFKRIGLCSGGERARAAFALRLALTQLVSQRTDTPVGFVVFDEIFGSQDPDHRQAILDSLASLRSIYPQTFLISHEESLRDSPHVDLIVDVPDADSVGRIQVTER